ncbi:MAG: hypothetical protein ACKE8G_03955 [Methylophagaceae bacterium]
MNHITATIEFNFKGETLTPTAILDLDTLMQQHGAIPPLHQMLAKSHNIDAYSYEYEMLLGEDVQFSNAKGSALDFMQDDSSFNQLAFEQHWHENQILHTLAPMIKQQLDIDDIDQHPKFKSIVIAAYQAGKNSSS